MEFVVFPMLHVASPVFCAEVTRRLGACAVPLWYRVLVWCTLPGVVVAQFFGGRRRLLAPTVAVNDDDLPDSDMGTVVS